MRKFVIVGNGAFVNRGCEAIIRGTINVLEGAFGGEFSAVVISHGHPSWINAQATNETDGRVTHLVRPSVTGKNWKWLQIKLNRSLGLKLPAELGSLDSVIEGATAVLSAGGDNYSLDYGLPYSFMEMDQYVMRRGIPLFVWAASVGPFTANPAFERQMVRHMRSVDGVLVRETQSFGYLASRGLGSRLYLVGDPAFRMDPVEPSADRFSIPYPSPIGVNLSLMLCHYATGGNHSEWLNRSRDIVLSIIEKFGEDVLLIPHVTGTAQCDHRFLSDVAAAVERAIGQRPHVVPDTLTAAEYKWVISQCRLFVGARTHATIAAFSTFVPTVTLAYSIKAWGLNQDIFGTTQYCLDAVNLTVDSLVETVLDVSRKCESIRQKLVDTIPNQIARADEAGLKVRQYLCSF